MEALLATADTAGAWDAAATIFSGRSDNLVSTAMYLLAAGFAIKMLGVPIVEWYKEHYTKKLEQGERFIQLEQQRQESDKRRDEAMERRNELVAEELRTMRAQSAERHSEVLALVSAIKPALENATAAGDRLDGIMNRLGILENQVNRILAIAGRDSR